MICFEIPYPRTQKGKSDWNKRFGLNGYYAGKHWSQRNAAMKELHELTRRALRQWKVPRRVAEGPVELRFLFNDRLDCSNHAVIVKGVEDAMKGRVIQDDSRRYVRRIITEFWDGDSIRVEIREI